MPEMKFWEPLWEFFFHLPFMRETMWFDGSLGSVILFVVHVDARAHKEDDKKRKRERKKRKKKKKRKI